MEYLKFGWIHNTIDCISRSYTMLWAAGSGFGSNWDLSI